MKKYSEKEVKKSIRNLQLAIDEIVTANSATYRSKVGTFIELTKVDPIIKQIVEPFRSINIDLDAVHYSPNPYRIQEIRLPLTADERIAYIIKMFDKVVDSNYSLDKFAYTIYGHRSLGENVNEYLQDIAVPRLKELQFKISDLIEDEVEGKGEVTQASFQIINHGTIQAQRGSNIAMGQDIRQTNSNVENIVHEIIEKVKLEGIVPENRIPEVESLANEVKNEIEKDNPSQSNLKQLAGRVYDIGEQALLKVFTTIVTDPRWGQVAAETLMNI